MASTRRTRHAKARRVSAPARKRAGKPLRAPKVVRPKKAVASKSKAKVKRKAPQTLRAQVSVVEAVLATFAHEVRTPLTGILAISDLLATSDLGERERRWVDTIKASSEHLSALATLFVDAARGKVSALGLRRDFFDLRAFARTMADSLSGRGTAKGLSVSVDIADGLPAFVIGDAVRLRAALENLIDNAVKFTNTGNVAFTADVIRAPKGKVGVRFAVADSGIGISTAEIRRLFRPFSQANVSIAQRFGGAGLGLSSVRQLARAMGGDVTAEPRDGGGTVFTFTTVLERAHDNGDAAQSGEVASAARPVLRILSVEDNPFGRVVLNAILQELGHQTEFIGRGEDAVERLQLGGFDVVLMDMVLPGIGGIEAIRRIRAQGAPHGRVAIIGVSGRDNDEKAALAAGADAFILKPVSPRVLAQTLAKILRGRSSL